MSKNALVQKKRCGRKLSIIGLLQPLISFVYGLVIGGVNRKYYIYMMSKKRSDAEKAGRIRVIVQDNGPIHRCKEVQLMNHLSSFFPQLSRQVWIQAVGRGLYQAGYGLIQFYTPIIFVNYVGLSATAVGIGIGSSAISGVVGNFLGGTLADSQKVGRKRTLLISASLAALASGVFALAHNLPMLIVANLLLGLSLGFYWTAADAAVTDLTTTFDRHNAFALLGLADNLGVGAGVLGGGALLALTDYNWVVFIVGSLIFLVFLTLIQTAIADSRQDNQENSETMLGWVIALNDKPLRIFVLVNLLFTTYIALVNTTLPLYFTNFVSEGVLSGVVAADSSPTDIASLFTWWYIGFGAVLQLPLAQILGLFSSVRALMISMLLWGLGFFLVWAVAGVASVQFLYEIVPLGVLGIATVVCKPFASALVAELAPESLRGVYMAVLYQCWALGYFIGPILGGWAMDQQPTTAHNSWIIAALSTICGLIILQFLSQNKVSNSSTLVTQDTASVTHS